MYDLQRPGKSEKGFRLFWGYVGIICIIIGCILLIPLVMLIPYPEEITEAKYFIIPGVVTIAAGYCLSLGIREKRRERIYKNQAGIIVTICWILVIVLSSIPFMLTGRYSFTQAVFECTSGYSTTGLSVVDVVQTSHMFLFFRSVMLFVGGIGLVLVVISVLSDRYGMKLFEAEGHSDKMLPNLIQSARVIVFIYSGYIAGGTVLYMIFGMDWFDALNHAIAAISTGGFSTRPESIGYYHSIGIEVVTIVLMLLGGMNFLVHLALLKGKWRKVYTDCEVRLSLFVYPLAAVILASLIGYNFSIHAPESLRISLFQAVSAMTTTGFQTVDSFKAWPSSMIFIMILLMVVGGGAGSTAGGIKQFRVYIMAKELLWNLKRKNYDKHVIFPRKIKRCGEDINVDQEVYRETSNFTLLYFLFFMAGTFIFTCFGYSVQDSMFEISSSLSTVGLSVGITGYDAHPVVLWISTVAMFVGRLEIYIILVSISKIFSNGRLFIKKKIQHIL